MGHLLHYPACHVLGSGVEWQYVIEVFVVELLLYVVLNNTEVHHHTVFVECPRLAHDRHFPVVSVQVFALATIAELQLVARTYLKSLFNKIHYVIPLNTFRYSNISRSR